MKKQIAVVLSLAAATAATYLIAGKTPEAAERFLFVWAGDASRKAPDLLATVDFDERSATYGKVLATTRLPESGGSGNEPHHTGLSRDGNVLAAGGLLSVLKGQPEIFFFDVADPLRPKLLSSADPPQASITDEFHALPDGGFLVTMMGGAKGHHPGRVVEFSKDRKLIAEHPHEPPTDGFNPHGISTRPERNLMVTSDFVCPSTTLHAVAGGLTLRGSVRVWDFRRREILKTIPIPEAGGTIDVQLIPGDKRGRAYTAGMGAGKLYLVRTECGCADAVFDFNTVAKDGWPQLLRMTRDGKRLFVTLNKAGKVAMLDTSDPDEPRLIQTIDLGPESGPHYLSLTRDERRLVVTDYFLNEDEFGKVHADGDRKVHVLKITPKGMAIDRRFQLDFNNAIPGGAARPHGVAMK